MADDKKPPQGPDLTKGVALAIWRRRRDARSAMSAATKRCCSCGGARRCSRSTRIARTTTGRSPKGSWSATRCAVRGTTPASTCSTGEALRAPALEPLACWKRRAARAARSSCARRWSSAEPRPRGKAPARRDRSSSSAAARRALRRPRCCGAQGYDGTHHDAQQRRRAAGRPARTCRRTISPARRPRSGSRCAPTTSTASNSIDLRLGASVAQIDRKARQAVSSRTASQRRLRPPAAGDGRRAGAACRSRAPTCRTCTRCARSPTAARSSPSRATARSARS